jgi:hypothetical protein
MKRVSLAIAVAIALAGAIAARLVARLALRDVPHVMDEIAYVLQAETFSGWHLTAPLRLPRAAFALWFVDDRTATFSIFPPGWAAVLAIGVRTGLRAWVNPLLHGATALVVGATAARIAGPRARVAAAAAWAFSPQAMLLAASLMSHTLVAFLAAVVAYAGVRLCAGRPRAWVTWAGGAALGAAATTRPLCAVAVGLGLLAFLGVAAARRRLRAGTIVRIVVPAALACCLLGAYNRALTGDPLRFPQSAYFDEHAPPIEGTWFTFGPGCNDLGFGHGCDNGIPNATHDLANALSNTGDNLRAWGLLVGPVVLGAFACGVARAGMRRRARDRVVLALAVTPVAAILLYALYWYAGTSYGARFYHAGLVAVVVVAAAAFARIRRGSTRWALVAAWLGLGAAATWGASREVARGYWGTDDRFARAAASWLKEPILVMVAFRGEAAPPQPSYFWTSFLRQPVWKNSVRALGALAMDGPLLDRRVLFAKYHPALVDPLRARFPERTLWLWIVEDDRADTIVPYDGSPFAAGARELPAPADDFDGFRFPP